MKTENNRVFYAACINSFILQIQWGIATTLLPIYVHEFGGSPLEVSLTFTVFAGFVAFTQPLWGFVSDYFGKRKIFMVFGTFGLIPILLLISTQTEPLPLILLRGSTAIFLGATWPTTLALISDISPREMVGRNLGVNSFFSMAGLAVGPLIGGVVSDSYGFAALWVFIAAICSVGGLIFLIFGSDPTALKRSRGRITPGFSGIGGMFRKISVLCVSSLLLMCGYALLGANVNVFYVEDLGLSRTEVGLITLIGTGASTLFQPFAGYFSDKYGRKPMIAVSAISVLAGLVGFYFTRDLVQAIPAAILFYNFMTFHMVSQAYISDVAKSSEKSSMMGLFTALITISISTGSVIGGLVIGASSLRMIIPLSTIFPILSIFIILLALKEPIKEEN